MDETVAATLTTLRDCDPQEIHLNIVFSAWDETTAEKLPTVLNVFQEFRHLPVTTRLVVLYPLVPTLLRPFCDNAPAALTRLGNLVNVPCEILLVKGTSDSTGSVVFPCPQERTAFQYLSLFKDWVVAADSCIARYPRPFASLSAGICVYEERPWREYCESRAQFDLTSFGDCALDPEPLGLARKHLAEEKMVSWCCDTTFSEGLGASTPVFLPSDGDDAPVLEEKLDRLEDGSAHRALRVLENKQESLSRVEANYVRFLNGCLEHRNVLTGLRQAVAIHTDVRELLESAEVQQPLLQQYLQNRGSLVLDRLSRCLGDLSGGAGSESRGAADLRDSAAAMVEYVEGKLASDRLSELQNCAFRLMAVITEAIHAAFAASSADEAHAEMQRASVLSPVQDLDGGLKKSAENIAEKCKELEKLHADLKGISRIAKPASFRARKKALLEEIEKLNAKRQQWISHARTCWEALQAFVHLRTELDLVARLVKEVQARVVRAGLPLEQAAVEIDRRNRAARQALEGIPEGPVVGAEGVSLFFLAKPEVEALYQRYGPAQVQVYGDKVKQRQREAGESVTDQFGRIRQYLAGLEAYCHEYFESRPVFDLPRLMFSEFPELVKDRLRQLVKMTAGHLIPLARCRQEDRRLSMLLGFPTDSLNRLSEEQADITYKDGQIALNPAEVHYIACADRKSLTLILMLYNYRLEDYLYWVEPARKDAERA